MPLTTIQQYSPLISTPVNDNFNYLDGFAKNIIKDNIGYGVRSGFSVSAQTTPDMTIKVSAGVAYLPSGMRVSISTDTILAISNPNVVSHSNEPHITDTSGIFVTDLKPIVNASGSYASISDVTVKLASDNSIGTVELIDPVSGQIDTALTSATSVKVDYYHGQERIDIIVINSSGSLQVIAGTPADSSPIAPPTPSGAIKLAEIKVKPKQTVCIESTDITNVQDIKGIRLDSNYNLVVQQDLIVLGSQVAGSVVNNDVIVRGKIYNDTTSSPVLIDDDLQINGSITITGTVDGRDISSDGTTLDTHIVKQVDTSSTDTIKDKHLSNALAKDWEDHKNTTGNVHSTQHNQLLNIGQVDTTSTDTVKDKHVSNALAKGWEDHKNSPHLQLGTTSTTAFRGDYGQIAYNHALTTGNAHSMDHVNLNAILGANVASTDTIRNKHVSDLMAKQWEDHRLSTSNPHSTTAAQVGALVSVDGVSNAGGDIDLVAGANINIVSNNTAKTITISGTGTWPNADTVDNLHASDFTPASHIGSGGTAHATATTSTAGFMSAADKSKLDGIQSGAEVNQNSFSYITVGAITIAADAKMDTLELISGTGIVLTPDATNDKITISVNFDDTLHGNRGGGSLHAIATTASAGFLSAADKSKLDSIQAGAEVNQYAFSNIVVGGTTIAADTKTDILELVAGTNISLTPDSVNDKITIAVNRTNLDADLVDGKHVWVQSTTPSAQNVGDIWIQI